MTRAEAPAAAPAVAAVKTGEEYEVEQPRPTGITWVLCADGGIYAKAVNLARADPRVQEGDKLIAVSASFGDEVWPAESYGQSMYAMRTRVGNVYMKILSRGGNMDPFLLEEDPAVRQYRQERRGGNYGAGTAEVQQKNYIALKENARKREMMFNEALEKTRAGKYEEGVIQFEDVRALEPKNYVGDNFERVTEVYKVSSYNIACCYSKLNNQEAALEALKDALSSGFDDYDKIRSDPNLEELRKSKKFKPLMDAYDEPIINMEALNALKDWFGKR